MFNGNWISMKLIGNTKKEKTRLNMKFLINFLLIIFIGLNAKSQHIDTLSNLKQLKTEKSNGYFLNGKKRGLWQYQINDSTLLDTVFFENYFVTLDYIGNKIVSFSVLSVEHLKSKNNYLGNATYPGIYFVNFDSGGNEFRSIFAETIMTFSPNFLLISFLENKGVCRIFKISMQKNVSIISEEKMLNKKTKSQILYDYRDNEMDFVLKSTY